jgi:hypothetical protein
MDLADKLVIAAHIKCLRVLIEAESERVDLVRSKHNIGELINKANSSLGLLVGKFSEQVAVPVDETICELLGPSVLIFGVG